MGRPATMLRLCEELRKFAISTGSMRIERPVWDRLVVRSAGVSIRQAETITRTGEVAGLWSRVPNQGRTPGWVVITP